MEHLLKALPQREHLPVDNGNPLDTLTQPQGSPLDALVTAPDTPTPQPLMSDASAARTARMAAVTLAPDPTMVDDVTKSMADTIKQSGDSMLRYQAAAKQQTEQIRAYNTVATNAKSIGDPELLRGALIATQHAVAQSLAQRAKYSLEQGAIQAIQDNVEQGNPIQAELLANNLKNGGPDDVIRDFSAKQLMLQTALDQAGVQADSQPWFAHLANFVLSALPLKTSLEGLNNVDLPGVTHHWFDFLANGHSQDSQQESLWSLPRDEFHDVLAKTIPAIHNHTSFMGYHNLDAELNLLTNLQHAPNPWMADGEQLVNNLAWLPVTKMAKLASIPALLVRQGGRMNAAVAIAKTIGDMGVHGAEEGLAKNGITAAEVVEGIAPKIINPEAAADTTVSTAGDTLNILDRVEELKAQLPTFTPPGRFSDPIEAQNAFEANVQNIGADFDREIKDVVKTEETLPDNSTVSHIEFSVGKADGSGFANQAQANKFAVSKGLGLPGEGGFTTVQDESGQWYVRAKRPMTESGMYATTLQPKVTDPVMSFLAGARNTEDGLASDLAIRSGNAKAAFVRAFRSIVKPFTSLRANEREALYRVILGGNLRKKWLSEDELKIVYDKTFNRMPTSREIEAYHNYRAVHDLDHQLRNSVAYKTRALQGMETITFDTGISNPTARENGLVYRNVKDMASRDRVYNVSDGLHYHEGNPLTAEEIQRLQSQGYIGVDLENPVHLDDGTTIKSFVMKGKDVKIEPLKHEQLAYSEGGHRPYVGKYNVRQTVYGTQADTGHKFLKNPNTYILTETQAEAKAWADVMEQARNHYATGKASEVSLDEIFGGRAQFPTGKEFLDGIKSGKFQADTPFITRYDREMPEEYTLQKTGVSNLSNPEENLQDSWLRTTGQMYNSHKGDAMPDWLGRQAAILDPGMIINRSLQNIANLSTFSDYKISLVERWANTFGKYITGVRDGASPLTIFNEGIFPKTNDQMINRLRVGAENQRNIIRRNIGWRTDVDRAQEQYGRNVAEWVGGNNPEGVRNAAAAQLTNWFNNAHPIQALKGLVFDMKIGMFNPVHFFMRLNNMVAAFSLDPKNAMNSLISSYALRGYMTKSGTDAMLAEMAGRGFGKASGFASEDEFKMFMKSFKQSGVADRIYAGMHGLINTDGPNVAMGQIKGGIDKVTQAGRMFVNEAELWNAMTAYHMAWKDVRNRFSALEPGTSFFENKLAGRAEDFNQQMGAHSTAAWQHGFLGIPTQFMSYNMRMMELMLGKTFTGPQRIRLALGQLLFYGSAGLPVTDVISEMMHAKNADAPSINSWQGALDRGLIDEVVFQVSGADTLVGQRLGIGAWLPDVYKSVFGLSEFGVKPPIETLTGPTGSTVGAVTQSILDLAKYAAAEGGGDTGRPLTRDAVINLVGQVSTLSNVIKAYMIFKYGTLITNKGTTLATDIPTADGFAMALGFQPGTLEDLQARSLYTKERQAHVDGAVKIIKNFRARMANEPDKASEIADEVNLFMKLQPPELQADIYRKSNVHVDPSVLDTLTRRTERAKVQEQLQSNMEQDSQQ